MSWLTQSDGYNIGVTLGSAIAALIFLAILFFILYQCFLKRMLQDYRNDKDSYESSKIVSAPTISRSLFKKKPQKLVPRENAIGYYNRTAAIEYDDKPDKRADKKLDESLESGGYRGEYGGYGAPVDYDQSYVREKSRSGSHRSDKSRHSGVKGQRTEEIRGRDHRSEDIRGRDQRSEEVRGQRGRMDLDSSTESKDSSVHLAQPPRTPERSRHAHDRSDREDRGSHEFRDKEISGSRSSIGSTVRDRSDKGPGRPKAHDRDQGSSSTYLTAQVPSRLDGHGKNKSPTVSAISYQTAPSVQQRTLQQQSAIPAGYIGSSV